MKAKTKFLKMYYKLPDKARRELVMNLTTRPCTLYVMWVEVKNDTALGRRYLDELGYKDDA